MPTPRYLGALTATACLALCLAPAAAGARGSCASRPVGPRLVHHVVPPQKFLSSLSVLRRPQTPADLQGFDVNEDSLVVVNVRGLSKPQLATTTVIYADYIRRLGSVNGHPEYLVPARVQLVAPMSRRCLRRLSVKARRQQLKLEKSDRARGVVLLFTDIMGTYSELISEGLARESLSFAAPKFAYGLDGIVPDGVASVALLSKNNPEITAQVTANFFSIEVPPPLQEGWATVIWRDASGHTLKNLPPEWLILSIPCPTPETGCGREGGEGGGAVSGHE